jgi:hypothetical protein
MKYIKSFNESDSYDLWQEVESSYDVYQLVELLEYKYGKIFKDTQESLKEHDSEDYNPDEVYEIIKYELESLNLFDDFVNNHNQYSIEKDENDPFHWRYRAKKQRGFMDNWGD